MVTVQDLVTVVGSPDDLLRVEAMIGERSHVELDRDQSALDATRVFVSRWDVVGVPLGKLDLVNKHQAIITRVRRGDLWFVPDGDTVLELGDRVRVTTRRDNIEAIEAFFGDSYRAISEVSFLTFAMGLAAGLALGQLPIPLGHGIVFKLGFAGGPLAYGRRAVDGSLGFVMGWSMFLECLFATIGTGLAAGGYIAFLINPDHPDRNVTTACAIACAWSSARSCGDESSSAASRTSAVR